MSVLVKRFLTNIKNPKMREKVGVYFAGKAIGLVILFMGISFFLVRPAHAQAGDPDTAVVTINAVNTMWTLVAAFLVFAMQAGFVMLEAGFARSREAVNVLVEGIADT